MKSKTRSAAAAIAGAAVIFVSVTPALAAADSTYVTLNSWSGTPGSSITASGGGWSAGDTIDLYFGSAAGTPVATATVQAGGTFSEPVSIPDTAPQGNLPIIAVDTVSHQQESNTYYVDPLSPSITITAPSHTPFSIVNVSGTGFAPNEIVDLGLAGASSTVSTDSNGSFTAATVKVPVVASGLYHLTATGASSGASVPEYSNYFWIDGFYPYASPSSYYLTPGSTLTFTGGGFAAQEIVRVYQGSTSTSPITTFNADSNGAFTGAGSVTIPFAAAHSEISYTLVGAESGATATVSTTVGQLYPSISPSSYYVEPNSSLTITGEGFAPLEQVMLSDGTATTTVSADAQGALTGVITVPFSKSGSATIRALGQTSDAQTSVGVTLASFYGSVSPSTYFAYPGSMISYRGTGFAPDETIAIQSGTSMSSIVADGNGAFVTASTTIPFNASGSVTTTFTGALSGASATVQVALGTLSAYLSSDAYSAQQGGVVHVTGYDFAPGETVAVHAGAFTTTTVAGLSGATPAVAVTMPYGVSNVQVTFTGQSSGAAASATIALAAFNPQVVPSTYYAPAGTPLSFQGSGFAPGEAIAVTYNGSAISATAASSSGMFTYGYTPAVNATAATFVFTGETSGAVAKVSIGIAPYSAYIQLSTYYAQGGSPLTITGEGFAPHESVTIKADDATVGTANADATGALDYVGTVPFGPAGTMTINAIGASSGASAAATITLSQIYPNLQLGSYAGAPGSAIDFIGSGYLPDETLSVTTDRTGSTPVYTFMSDENGSFNDSGYRIPANWTGGPLTITVEGDHSFAPTSISYYVTGN